MVKSAALRAMVNLVNRFIRPRALRFCPAWGGIIQKDGMDPGVALRERERYIYIYILPDERPLSSPLACARAILPAFPVFFRFVFAAVRHTMCSLYECFCTFSLLPSFILLFFPLSFFPPCVLVTFVFWVRRGFCPRLASCLASFCSLALWVVRFGCQGACGLCSVSLPVWLVVCACLALCIEFY